LLLCSLFPLLSSLFYYHDPSSPLCPYPTLSRSDLRSLIYGNTVLSSYLVAFRITIDVKVDWHFSLRTIWEGYFNFTGFIAGGAQVWLCSLFPRSEEHTSELQSRFDLVCRLLLEKKNKSYFINLIFV